MAAVIPLGNLDAHRQAAWEHVRGWWWEQSTPVVTGVCDGPWSKGLAVASAITQAPDGLIAVADADVIVPGLQFDAVTWCLPANRLVRLTATATLEVLAGADVVEVGETRGNQLECYRPKAGGGMVLLARDAYLACPIDPRFIGWGGEDEAWGSALRTMYGPPQEQRLTMYHLWHPPQARPSRSRGSAANEALKSAYLAARNQSTLMALIQEGREAA